MKESVALNPPNKHEKATQSITDTIETSKKEIVDNIKKACALHGKKAGENAFKFWSDEAQTSWVVADKNDNVFYSFTLKA